MDNCVTCRYFDDYFLYNHWIFHCRKTKAVIFNPDDHICGKYEDRRKCYEKGRRETTRRTEET